MNGRRAWEGCTLLSLLLTVGACDNGPSALVIPADESPSGVEEVIRRPEDYPAAAAACPTRNAEGLTVVALDGQGTPETYLPAEFADRELAADYEQLIPTAVDSLALTTDYDRNLSPETTRVSGACPERIGAGLLLPDAVDEGVVSATLEASFDGEVVRAGRVFATQGTGRLTLRTAALGVTTAERDDWYFLFEPAFGEPRLMLLPADPSGEAFEARGVPKALGVAALVHAPMLRLDGATGAIYAPADFATSWRTQVDRAYVAVLLDASSDRLVSLEPLVAEGELRARRSGLAEDAELDDMHPVAWLGFGPRRSSGQLSRPCGRELTLLVAGFATGTLGIDGDTRALGSGQALTLPALHCGGAATRQMLDITLRSSNAMQGMLVARLASVTP
ncbi:MAG: hypothetical protein GXP55_20585 [Deltaproteobacteria bacterium]|nr:hypothetical protein [Deltaproteobacteria bacterium]